MSLPPLKQVITADTNQFDTAIGNATQTLRRFAGPIGVGAALEGIRRFTREAMNNIDQQAKLARAVGGTTSGLQALARAGDRAGVQQSELASASTRLNQRLGQVIATGKGAEDTFKRMGISAQDLARMDIDERFIAISNAMKEAGMSTQEMSFHLRELGIRQSSVITLIQGGAEEIERSRRVMEEFGVAVSEIDAASIERANDALSEVGRVFEGLRNQMAVRLAPAIEATANAFTEMAREGGPVHTLIRGFVEQLPRIVSYLQAAAAGFTAYGAVIATVAVAKMGLAAATNGLRAALLRLGIPALVIAAGEMLHQFSRLVVATGSWGGALEALGDLASAVWDGIKTSASAIFPALSAVWEDVKAGFFGLMEALTQRWADFLRTLGAGLSGIPGMEDAFLSLHGAAVKAQSSVYGFQEAVDEANASAEQFRDEAASKFAEGGEKIADAMQNLREIMNKADDEIYGPDGAPAPFAEGGTDISGGGGGGGVADALRDRLDAVQNALATEHEMLEEWYRESLETLQEARARELITEEEYWEAKARLQEEYNARARRLSQEELNMRRQTANAAIGLLEQFGQKNKALAKVAVALNAAQRVSEITANTAAAATRALAELGPVAGPPAAARITAYGRIQAGIAAASASLRMGGGGGGGSARVGGGSGDATQAQAAPQQIPTQTLRFDFGGQNAMGMEQIVDLLNDAYDRGYRVKAVMA